MPCSTRKYVDSRSATVASSRARSARLAAKATPMPARQRSTGRRSRPASAAGLSRLPAARQLSDLGPQPIRQGLALFEVRRGRPARIARPTSALATSQSAARSFGCWLASVPAGGGSDQVLDLASTAARTAPAWTIVPTACARWSDRTARVGCKPDQNAQGRPWFRGVAHRGRLPRGTGPTVPGPVSAAVLRPVGFRVAVAGELRHPSRTGTCAKRHAALDPVAAR